MEEEERKLLFEKIEEWQEKAQQETDPFNKYISIFISFNIFYNLFEKTKNPDVDLAGGDGRRAIASCELISNPNQLFQSLKKEIGEYLQIIPVFREEYWPSNNARNKEAISEALRKSVNNKNSKMAIEMLMKWLYKVRCNLVHGEKNYNDVEQKNLLNKSSSLMDGLLKYLVSSYHEKHIV